MIQEVSGDLFESDAEVLVNPVNVVGVMGKGLAKAFAERYPLMVSMYQEACKSGSLRIGTVHAVFTGDVVIINAPTKKHWRDPSEYEYVETTLYCLRLYLLRHSPASAAMPYLGCGLGGLDRTKVRELVEKHLSDVDTTIYLYG